MTPEQAAIFNLKSDVRHLRGLLTFANFIICIFGVLLVVILWNYPVACR